MSQVHLELTEEKAWARKLEGTIKDQTTHTNSLQQRLQNLEADVSEHTTTLEQAKAAWAAQEAVLKAQAQNLQEKPTGTESSLEQVR
jgi:phage shock protein A